MPKTLRAQLYVLVLGALAPLVVLTIALGAVLIHVQREAARQETLGRARAILAGIETAVDSSEAALRTLAGSKSLARHDLRAFHEESRHFLALQPHLSNISLASVEGENLTEAVWLYGVRARVYTDLPSFYLAAKEGVTTYGNVAVGPATGAAALRLRVPVILDGGVRYIISAPHRLEWFEAVLRSQNPPPDWIVALLDANRHMIARQPTMTPSSASLQAALEGIAAGSFSARSIDGAASYTTSVSSPRTGWTLAIAVPQREVDGLAWRTLVLVAASAAVALSIALLLALKMSTRMAAERRDP